MKLKQGLSVLLAVALGVAPAIANAGVFAPVSAYADEVQWQHKLLFLEQPESAEYTTDTVSAIDALTVEGCIDVYDTWSSGDEETSDFWPGGEDAEEVTYQWYVRVGETWSSIDGATEDSYEPEITDVGEYDYKCAIGAEGKDDKNLASDVATITVKAGKTDISEATVTASKQTYTGKKLTPEVTVELDGEVIDSDDYSVTYSNNTNAGTATVTVTANEDSEYKGSATGSFTIAKAKLSGASVSSIADQTYTGKAITPAVTVKFGGKTLTKGTDYTITYSNNKNKGTAGYKITAKSSNFTGSKSGSFKIKAASIAKATVTISDKTYTGENLTPKVTVVLGSKTLTKGTDYTVASGKYKDAGTYTVKVTGKGNYSGTAKGSFEVKTVKLTKATVTVRNQKYNGKKLNPSVTVKVGDKTLKKGTDYTVSYENNKKVGKATVTIKGKGNYAGTKTANFQIVKTPVTKVTLNKKSVTLAPKKEAKIKATVTKNATIKGVTWKSSNEKVATVDKNGKVTAVKAGTATITATAKDNTNTVSAKATVKVANITLDKTKVSVKKGKNAIVTATLKNDSIKSVVSNSRKIATVSFKKNVITVKGVKKGTAKITVRTKAGIKKTITVKVK